MLKPRSYYLTEEHLKIKEEATKWLLEDGNNYCAIPYRHMAIEANGDIRPCCMGDPFKGVNIKKTNSSFSSNPTELINARSINDVLNDPVRQKFIDSFDQNKQHPACDICWKDNNKHSTRIKFSTRPETIEATVAAMNNNPSARERKLTWLEIKPGNRCNLKCRICGVHNSSQWTKDAYEHNKHFGNTGIQNFKESHEYKYTNSCNWIDDEKFWNDIESFDQIQLIHFMGGEPFMVPEHFNMLKKIIDSDKIDSKNITIRYNTNGTYFLTDEQINILENFYEVGISISVDDIEDRFEYQRKLATWSEVKNNLIKYQNLNQTSKVIYSVLDPTISIYNIWWIDEIEKEFNNIGYNLWEQSSHFVQRGSNDCRVLPPEILDYLIKKYSVGSGYQQNIANYLQTAKPFNFSKLEETINSIDFYDSIRKESFAKHNPELHKWIQKFI